MLVALSQDGPLLKGIFLLVLAVAGNFIAETLGCETQSLLTNNMYAKQFIIVAMIYFATAYSSTSVVDPAHHMKQTLFIWALFLMFTKMNVEFTVAVFGVLIMLYVSHQYMDFYNKTKQHEKYNRVAVMADGLEKVAFVLLLVGFGLYANKQWHEHRKTFSPLKFIFGVKTCASLR